MQSPPSLDRGQTEAKLTTTTERKLLAKIDLHILPVLCILYLLAFLDRYAMRIRVHTVQSSLDRLISGILKQIESTSAMRKSLVCGRILTLGMA